MKFEDQVYYIIITMKSQRPRDTVFKIFCTSDECKFIVLKEVARLFLEVKMSAQILKHVIDYFF